MHLRTFISQYYYTRNRNIRNISKNILSIYLVQIKKIITALAKITNDVVFILYYNKLIFCKLRIERL